MDLRNLQDETKRFSVVVFLMSEDFDRRKEELEAVGKLNHVKMVIQPCPYEGIEFLCRVAHDLIGHHLSLDKDIFWQAIELKADTSEEDFGRISRHHHQYLCAILKQDPGKVTKERRSLEALSEHFS